MPYRKRPSAKRRRALDAAVAGLKTKREALAERLEQVKLIHAGVPSFASRIADIEAALRELDEFSARCARPRTSLEMPRGRRIHADVRKVSCICVTRDRPHLLPLALASYLSQDWDGEKELIVVDDGVIPVESLIADIPGAIYVRPERNWRDGVGLTIGAKRNMACSRATGDVFFHVDDDDWFAADRISTQVQTLVSTGKCVTSFYLLNFWDARNSLGYQIPILKGAGRIIGYGTSMAYRREWWECHPFFSTSQGEDSESLIAAGQQGQLVTVDGSQKIVVVVHNRNTCQYPLEREIPIESFPAAFFDAFTRTFCGSTNAFKRTMEDIAGGAGGLSQWTPEVV
jgi:hypothetical protein